MIKSVSYLVLCVSSVIVLALTAASAAPPEKQEPTRPETTKTAPLTPSEVAELQTKAEAGDADAQLKFGKAYQEGNGVPQNDVLAAGWFKKAAEQGDCAGENNLGIAYRMGEGVERNKEEAVRWYSKAAKHGCAPAMFNLGVSYYNGDGVPSNVFTAYAWFLLAQHMGDKVADDAVQRSAATMSPNETADTFIQIASMYEKGEELPKSDEEALRWLRMAASITPQAKVRLATHLVNEPEPTKYYGEVVNLCKSAAKENYPKGLYCVGYMYRKGWGVPQDSVEAVKWYQRAAGFEDPPALMELADMELSGEGTKVDRPAAFLLLLHAAQIGVEGSREKASHLLAEMDKTELKRTEKKLRDQRFDPKRVFSTLRANPAS
jgi:TPR repeat protein